MILNIFHKVMTFAFVNIGVGNADASATSIASAATSHTSGNALIVFVANEDSRTVTQVADTALNSYTERATFQFGDGTPRLHVFTAFSITGNASNVVTATLSGAATFRRIRVMQYSYAGTAQFHGTGTGSAVSVSNDISLVTSSSSSIDSNTSGVIAACAYLPGAVNSSVLGNGFSSRGTASGAGIDTVQEDRITSLKGIYNASYYTINMTNSGDGGLLHCMLVEAVTAPRRWLLDK